MQDRCDATRNNQPVQRDDKGVAGSTVDTLALMTKERRRVGRTVHAGSRRGRAGATVRQGSEGVAPATVEAPPVRGVGVP